jgi:hypothetical protein
MRFLALLLGVLVLSCEQPVEPQPEEDTAAAPSPPVEPSFIPEPYTIYILNADDEVFVSTVCDDPARWPYRCKAFRNQAYLYNRDGLKPGPYPYRFVAGEPPQ